MNNYIVEEDDTVFSVVEKTTETVVYQAKKLEQAKQMCSRLNSGTGFQGFTPTFFTREATIKFAA